MTQTQSLFFLSKSLMIIIYFIASLYLISFGFFGTNVYGFIDGFIPFERIMLLIICFVFISLSGFNFGILTKKYLEIIHK